MEIPEVRYIHGPPGGSIAYQVWGAGDVDVLLMTERTTSVDNIWEHPGRVRLLSFQGTLGRVLRFDPRGFGASDPLPLDRVGDVEPWVEDALTVLDTLGIERVVVDAEASATHVAVRLAVEHPDRVLRLCLHNPWARFTVAVGHPFGLQQESASELVDMVRSRWGDGTLTRASVPTLATGAPDPGFLGRTERLGASPSVMARTVEAWVRADVRPLLSKVCVPTLVVYTGDHMYISLEQSRFVAEHIPNARFLEIPSQTFYWSDGGSPDITAFIAGRVPETVDRELCSVLFTDIVGSTTSASDVGDERWRQIIDQVDDFVSLQVKRCGGRLVKQTGDGHLATFPAPRQAIDSARGILRGVPTLGVAMRAGIHTGEIEHRRDGDVGGISVHIAARVAGLAGQQELLVSRTVSDLVAGSEFDIEDRGDHELKGVPGTWTLFAVR